MSMASWPEFFTASLKVAGRSGLDKPGPPHGSMAEWKRAQADRNADHCWSDCAPPGEPIQEASHRMIVAFMLDCNEIGHVAAAENLVRAIKREADRRSPKVTDQ